MKIEINSKMSIEIILYWLTHFFVLKIYRNSIVISILISIKFIENRYMNLPKPMERHLQDHLTLHPTSDAHRKCFIISFAVLIKHSNDLLHFFHCNVHVFDFSSFSHWTSIQNYNNIISKEVLLKSLCFGQNFILNEKVYF